MNYFQVLFWPGGGGIGLILWCLNVIVWSLIIQHFVIIRRTTIVPDLVKAQLEEFFANKRYREAIEMTANDPSFLGQIVHASLSEAKHGYPAMERALDEAAEHRVTRMLRYTEWLNLLGNLGPMIGLFGTVWGLIKTFFVIVEKGGSVKPAELAEALGIKLVCTLLGLAVAIPALAIYGVMRNKIDSLTAEGLVTAQQFISNFRPAAGGAKKPE